MRTIRREFIDELYSNNQFIVKEHIKHNDDPRFGHRIRFFPESGIVTEQQLKEAVEKMGAVGFEHSKASGAAIYQDRGFKVNWNGTDFALLLNSRDSAVVAGYPRKTFSPEKLGLNGQKFTDAKTLFDTIINGVNNLSVDQEHKDLLVDLATSLYQDKNIRYHAFFEDAKEKNKVESDFGESLAALYSLKTTGKAITFPKKINNAFGDFLEGNTPVSVKSTLGGSVNLSNFADRIPKNTAIERVFWACGNYDKEELFKASAEGCSFIQDLADLVGGTSEAAVAKYIKTHSYDDFYNWVDTHPKNLNHWGVPADEKSAREYWVNGDTHNRCPFYFTLCTLIQKVWAVENDKEVAKVLKGVLTGSKFYDVNIDLRNDKVVVTEQKFKDVDNWTFLYWSRASAAFHNWPGAARKKKPK